jgi:hypothetical protein
MPRRTVLSVTLLAAASVAWTMEAGPGTPVIKPTVVNGEQSIAIDAGDLKQVAKARFYVSNDQGKTWTLAQETAVDPANPQVPHFNFKPAADGSYYIVTATVYRDGRAEAEPKANSIPAKAMLLVVDATPPVVSTLDATPETITDPNATTVSILVTWAIADANFASATLETSSDGGATFTTAQTIPATGSTKLALPSKTKDGTVQLRIVAKDVAGNQAPSLAKSVTLPQPPDPEKALAAAVGSLPTLADVQPAPEPLLKPEDTKAVDAAGQTTPGTAAPGTAAPGTPASADKAAPVTPVATAPTTTTRTVTVPANTSFLSSPGADNQLTAARALRDDGNVDGALSLYLRLHDSTVSKTAVAEELAMLAKAGDAAAVVAIGDALPPELRTDAARLEHGKALLALGRASDADAQLMRVRKGSEEARMALLYLGKSAAAQGKTAVATKIYERLATGDDAVATEAKLLRGK